MRKLKEFFSDVGYYLVTAVEMLLYVLAGVVVVVLVLAFAILIGWLPIFFFGSAAAWVSVPLGIVIFFALALAWADRSNL